MAMSVSSEIGKLSLKDETTWTIEWTIEDFFSYTEKDRAYTSPHFTVPGSQWFLRICPNYFTEDASVAYVSVFLYKYFPEHRIVTANFTLGVKTADGTIKETVTVSHDFIKNTSGYGCNKFLAKSELLEKKSELAPVDALTLVCYLRIKDNFDSTSPLIELSENFGNMLTSKKFSDVTLKVQHKEFPAHKSILATRSSVFAAMLDADMKEKNTGIVDIVDCDSGAFEDFLTFLYSGQCEVCPENVFNLYRIAHKYDVEELQSYCVVFIVNNLSLGNLYDSVILGDEFDDEEVNIKSRKFFINNFKEIVSTSEWDSFSKKNWRLANNLIKSLAADMK